MTWLWETLHSWLHAVPLVVLAAVWLNCILILRLRGQSQQLQANHDGLMALHERVTHLHERIEQDIEGLHQRITKESTKEDEIHDRILNLIETVTGKCNTTHEQIRMIDELMRRIYEG